MKKNGTILVCLLFVITSHIFVLGILIDNNSNLRSYTDIFMDRSLTNNEIEPDFYWTDTGIEICTSPGEQIKPEICSDGVGGAIIAWTYDGDIYANHINSSGQKLWAENGVPICTAINTQSNIQISSDNIGGAILTWEDSRMGNKDIYVQWINSTGHVKWKENGVAMCNSTGNQAVPAICNDGMGGAIITWEDQRAGNWDIYAQRINSSGHMQWNITNGLSNGTVVCLRNGDQTNPKLCNDSFQGAIITWIDDSSGTWDIYAQRINSTGYLQWNMTSSITDGIPICNDDYGQQYEQDICNDGSQGAIITWADQRTGTFSDIYAQKINSTGHAQWNVTNGLSNGTAICTGSDYQNMPKLCSDSAGGAIITWHDQRTDSDIYSQYINSSGEIQWTINGIAVCNADQSQGYAQICTDGLGGAIITWEDYRASQTGIYAQWVNSSGSVLWNGTYGYLISLIGEAQYQPKLCCDGYGNVIITWEDYRNGGNGCDIYAQKIFAQDAPVLNSITPNPNHNGIINLNWTKSDSVIEYFIYKGNTPIVSIAGMVPIGIVNGDNYNSTAINNNTYYYTIVARYSFGNSPISNCESVAVLFTPLDNPLTPLIDPILPDTSGNVNLDWNDVSDANSYSVYRATSPILSVDNIIPLATVYSSSFSDSLTDGTYYYVIMARNASGIISISACESVEVIVTRGIDIVLIIILASTVTAVIGISYFFRVKRKIKQKMFAYFPKTTTLPLQPPFNAYEGDEPYLFVSYAHADKVVVYHIIEILHKKGIRIWYDEGIPPSENWIGHIADTLRNCESFMIFISPRALKSENVKDEIAFAKGLNKQIFPIYIEETKLSHDIQLQIGRFQALHLNEMTEDMFLNKIKKKLNQVFRMDKKNGVAQE